MSDGKEIEVGYWWNDSPVKIQVPPGWKIKLSDSNDKILDMDFGDNMTLVLTPPDGDEAPAKGGHGYGWTARNKKEKTGN